MFIGDALEISTTLLITYATSEYLHGSNRRAIVALAVAVASLMLSLISQLKIFETLGAAKVPLCATCFLSALYYDVVVRLGQFDNAWFATELCRAMVSLLPLFPVLSLLIAFSLLEIGEMCEKLGLPTAWLNGPIYFGVLYLPFAFVYVRIKRIGRESTVLPLSNACS
jgi:hypothetical protein